MQWIEVKGHPSYKLVYLQNLVKGLGEGGKVKIHYRVVEGDTLSDGSAGWFGERYEW
jgi:hypothetical protein